MTSYDRFMHPFYIKQTVTLLSKMQLLKLVSFCLPYVYITIIIFCSYILKLLYFAHMYITITTFCTCVMMLDKSKSYNILMPYQFEIFNYILA